MGDWKGRKVLVTGAGGFIGSHLTERLLSAGADVTALVRYSSSDAVGNLAFLPEDLRNKLKIVRGNVEDGDLMHSACEGIEVVFHLAALIGIPYSYLAPESYVDTNVRGTLQVLRACRRRGVQRMMQTSTSEVYGSGQSFPMTEAHPLRAQSPYAASKIAADQMVDAFHRSFQLPTTIVRPFNTFGPRQSARAVIPTIVSQALRKEPFRLGNLDTERDLLFVRDTAAGMMAAAASEKTVGETLNLGTGRSHSIRSLVQKVARLLGVSDDVRTEVVRVRPDASEVDRLCASAERMHALTGWRPEVDLDAGLAEVVDFARRHPEVYADRGYRW